MAETARVALITGANKGIGFEVARQLAQAGVTVLLGARDGARGKAAAALLKAEGLSASVVRIDVTDPGSLRAAAAVVQAGHRRLDILVNNAGVSDRADGAPSTARLDAVRRTFEVNFFGALATTQIMLPLLKRAPAARVVNVSSSLGSLTRNAERPTAEVRRIGYNASKAALNMLTVQLASELAGTAIKINAVAPGFTATDLTDHLGSQTPATPAAHIVRLALLPEDGPTGGFFAGEEAEPW
ncbi:MAG: SDR family oxidoreductase [Vicinamibacterales bacterium]